MHHPILIDGKWRQASQAKAYFQAIDPSTGLKLEDEYPISSWEDMEIAIAAGKRAVADLRGISPNDLALFMEKYADTIERHTEVLIKMAAAETALPEEPRLRSIELPRTTNQLRQAAAAARDRSWRQVAIETRLNLRSFYDVLDGPVVIFAPNNFPFAFNAIAGGDFAAALAAGNPIIAKAHPGYPGTTRLFAEMAQAALQTVGLPGHIIQMFYHLEPEDGFRLVAHPQIGATAFTGSRKSGLALKNAADKAGKLIYVEMSGINPVFLLPQALEERAEKLAAELASSCTLGTGQFCTNPGLVIAPDSANGTQFLHALIKGLSDIPPGKLLGQQVLDNLNESIERMQRLGAEVKTGGKAITGNGFGFANTLLTVSGNRFLKNSQALQTEAFGPVTLVVMAQDSEQMETIAAHLEGNLTGSIYSHSQGEDDSLYFKIAQKLTAKVGRLLNDKMPTGVAVSPAMHHGGPYPATGHPGFTSVGLPRAMLRFSVLQCYDNVRHHRLPEELQDKNPTGLMWRWIDGTWTQADIQPPATR